MAGGNWGFATQNGLLHLLCVLEQDSSTCLPQYVDFGLPPAQACVCLWCQDCTLVVGFGSNCCVVL